MIHLPDCVCIMKNKNNRFEIENNDYEEIINTFIKENSQIRLFTKESVMQYVKKYYCDFFEQTINESEWYRNSMKEIMDKKGVIRETFTLTNKEVSYTADFVLFIHYS